MYARTEACRSCAGRELERVSWRQLVGSGDGQSGPTSRYFIGVARVEGDLWPLMAHLRYVKDVLADARGVQIP